jgi:hypothetical protein
MFISGTEAMMLIILSTVGPSISTTDLQIPAESSSIPANVRPHLQRELANRMQHGKMPAKKSPLPRK